MTRLSRNGSTAASVGPEEAEQLTGSRTAPHCALETRHETDPGPTALRVQEARDRLRVDRGRRRRPDEAVTSRRRTVRLRNEREPHPRARRCRQAAEVDPGHLRRSDHDDKVYVGRTVIRRVAVRYARTFAPLDERRAPCERARGA